MTQCIFVPVVAGCTFSGKRRGAFTELASASKVFRIERTLELVGTASPITGNLALCKESGKMAVIHPGYLSFLNVDGAEKTKAVACRSADGDGPTIVSQVLWCKLGNATWMAIASSRGLQIFDEDASTCFFSHACHEGQDASPTAGSCALSLAAVANQVLCVGCSSGSIYVFRVLDKQHEAVLTDRPSAHDFGVECLAAPSEGAEPMLASGDHDGNVSVWNLQNDRLKKEATFYSYGFACTALCWWNGRLVVAYGSGHIRLYSVISQAALLVEVAAHSRWITAMDLAADANRLLTVSEDAFIRIWQLAEGQPMIQHLYNIYVQDAMLFGARFVTSSGSSFCVSSYDCDQVIVCGTRQ